MSILPPKTLKFGDLDFKSSYGQNHLSVKDVVVICINFHDDKNIKNQLWQNQLEYGQKRQFHVIFSILCH